MKFKQEKVKNGIWTGWVRPMMNRYHMACCDCGLVHTMNFRAVEITKSYKDGQKLGIVLPKSKYQIEFKLFRNEKLTKGQRKKKS